jgi:non-heme chloroperoxidase
MLSYDVFIRTTGATRGNMNSRYTRLFATILLLLIASLSGFAQGPDASRIEVNDVEIHYLEKGTGEPLILLHGGLYDLRSWEPQFEEFSKKARVISYSRRYSYPNKNTLTADYRPALTDAADLKALLGKLGLKKVHLVGLSYGALTGLIFAIENPNMVASMTLAEPPAHQLIRDTPNGERMYQDFLNELEPMKEAFRAGDDRLAIVNFSRNMGRDFEKLPPAAAATMLQNAPALKAINLSPHPAFPGIKKEDLRKLKVPTLMIKGERADRLHSAVTDELARLIPGARSVTVPEAGHASPRENPVFFNSTVFEFLTSVKMSQTAGAVNGTMSDPVGAVIPGARVSIHRSDRPAQSPPIETRSDHEGKFQFRGLPNGEYRLSAVAPGFGSVTERRVLVSGNKAVDVVVEISSPTAQARLLTQTKHWWPGLRSPKRSERAQVC